MFSIGFEFISVKQLKVELRVGSIFWFFVELHGH